ncbi:NAD-dependent epimerase/dehydratase family protein [Brachybacterium sp. Z12]|uniref:NAD-dependent epimerase/dehydratase family protein n=1 Tax=Brachybacterium sp. Z12 TaxID=2759167 RepID=UPI00223BBD2A|nr:NAD-dependent epimerase/dehydratase family protein [Brachybacterium sp. Z12]
MHRLLAFRARQLRDDLAFHARWAQLPRRTIAITGSSGLIGTQLAALLETGGHTVRRMIRESEVGPGEISWDPQAGQLDPADLEGVDVVVNLAGRSIATRWGAGARREIRDSRVHGTRLIARTLAGMRDGPAALIQASAIGLYGPRRPGSCSQRPTLVERGSLPIWSVTGRAPPGRPRRPVSGSPPCAPAWR